MHNYLIPSFVSYNPIWSSLHPQILAHRYFSLFMAPHATQEFSIKLNIVMFPKEEVDFQKMTVDLYP